MKIFKKKKFKKKSDFLAISCSALCPLPLQCTTNMDFEGVVSSPHKSMEFQLRAPHVHAALVDALGPPDGWKDRPLVTCVTNDATQEYNKKATRSAGPPRRYAAVGRYHA